MTEPPFRQLLCLVAAGATLATLTELALIGHWGGWLQATPWLAGQANLAAAWAVAPPTSARQLRVGRALAATTTMAGAAGAAVHLQINWGFEAELNPGTAPLRLLFEAARGGLPLLAPLALALPAALVVLASWPTPQPVVSRLASQPPAGQRRCGPPPPGPPTGGYG